MIAAPAATVPAPVAARPAVLGRSAEDRPIRLWRVGDPRSPRRVLVVGSIHGTEPAGRAVIRALRRRAAPRGVELWLIDTANPDGSAAGTRQNAHGVDLNRNFPARWRLQGRPGSTYYSGARPLSEPESRLLARLILRLRPGLTIWYHQALRLVDLPEGDARLARRYARLSGLPARQLGFLPGVATRWENRVLPRGRAFVVELPSGRLDAAGVARHLRAVRDTAARSAPR